MGARARIVTGRRSKWLVVLVWVVLVVPVGALGAKLVDVTDNRTESFLPAEAESTEALRPQEQRFPGGETVSGPVVYRRTGGLTEADGDRRRRAARGRRNPDRRATRRPVRGGLASVARLARRRSHLHDRRRPRRPPSDHGVGNRPAGSGSHADIAGPRGLRHRRPGLQRTSRRSSATSTPSTATGTLCTRRARVIST